MESKITCPYCKKKFEPTEKNNEFVKKRKSRRDSINFCDYATSEELYEKTGLTVKQALRILDLELAEIRKKREKKSHE